MESEINRIRKQWQNLHTQDRYKWAVIRRDWTGLFGEFLSNWITPPTRRSNRSEISHNSRCNDSPSYYSFPSTMYYWAAMFCFCQGNWVPLLQGGGINFQLKDNLLCFPDFSRMNIHSCLTSAGRIFVLPQSRKSSTSRCTITDQPFKVLVF